MGLFNLFKSKPPTFEKKCLIEGPAYLKNQFRDIPDELYAKFRMKENEFTWTRQIISPTGATQFRLKYFGELNGSLVMAQGDLPVLLKAIDPATEEEILLFDGACHGYNAVFWEQFPKEIEHREAVEDLTIDGVTEVELIVLVRYKLELKAEFDEELTSQGFVENDRAEKLDENDFLNGYDSIQVFAFTAEGKKIEILTKETA